MPAPDLPFPYEIPGYELIGFINRGGFGQVYQARERSDLALLRAVKIIDPGPFQDEAKSLARFKREAEALSALEHRAIVRYVASGVTANEPRLPYLVTEFVEGTPFRSGSGLSDLEIVEKMAEILEALGHAHSMGILHRDVKPSNLLIRTKDGQPIILDFGLALFLEEDSTALTTRYAGSMGYVPPEVQSGEQKSSVNHDIFSCAVTLYEALVGRRPDIQSPQPLSFFRTELAPLDSVVRQGLASFSSRFKTAALFASELRESARRMQSTRELSCKNPTAEALYRKAIQVREASRKRQIEEEKARTAIRETWRAWNAIVCPAAKQAFVDMLMAAKEMDEKFVFVEEPESPDHNGEDVTPLMLLCRKGMPGGIVFGLASTNEDRPLGKGARAEMVVKWPSANGMSVTRAVPEEELPPAWLVFSEGPNQSPSRIIYGALIAVHFAGESAFRLFARPPRISYSVWAPTHEWPQEKKTSTEIRTYITEAIGQALGL